MQKAEKGKQVALSIPNVTAGRQVVEEEILYVDMNESNFRKLKVLKRMLSPEEIAVLKEFVEIKRKQNHLWGV